MTLRQLTRNQITHLVAQPTNAQPHTPVMVHAVLTRLTDPQPTVVYDGPLTLLFQFSRHDGRRKLKASEPSRLVLISVQGMDWAEYHIDHDIAVDGSCVVEDYQMLLFSLDGQGSEKGAHEQQATAQAHLILDAVRHNLGELGVETVITDDHP